MRLFIIGNGFDLAHGLRTSYGDFRDYIEENNRDFLINLEEMYGIYSVADWMDKVDESVLVESVKNSLWREFESNLSNIDENIIYNGIDIELGLESGDIGILDTLDNYWEAKYNFINDLNSYVFDWVRSINISTNKRTSIIDSNTNDKFLSFNYTMLLEEIYNIKKVNIKHIHGSIDEMNDMHPIIGHGSSDKIEEMNRNYQIALKNYEEKSASIYGAVMNYYKKTFKDTRKYISINYKFFEELTDVKSIFVIGHSLGQVDIEYFKEIKNNVDDEAIWNIYYYCKEDELSYKQKIINLGINENKIRMFSTEDFFDL